MSNKHFTTWFGKTGQLPAQPTTRHYIQGVTLSADLEFDGTLTLEHQCEMHDDDTVVLVLVLKKEND